MDFGMPYLLEMNSIEECCALASELGLSFVELNANFPACQVDRLDPAELHCLEKQYGLYFTLHLEEECDPFAFNDTVRHGLQLATALQMPIVNMHFPKGVYITLPEERVFLYERYAQEFRRSLDELRELCVQELSGTTTRIVIENTSGWMAHEQRAIEYLLEAPVFGLTLDIGHSHGVENVDESFFRRHDDKLLHMHGHDALGRKNHLALGDGEINLHERFAWAQRRNARVVLETKTVEALRKSVARLPKINAKI